MRHIEECTHLVRVFKEPKGYCLLLRFEGFDHLGEFLRKQPMLSVGPKINEKVHKKRIIGLNIASVLLKCHRAGVVHRDVKLENVIVREDLSVRLIDFGFAMPLQSPDERLKGNCGTPYYIPPEMVRRISYDGRWGITGRQRNRCVVAGSGFA